MFGTGTYTALQIWRLQTNTLNAQRHLTAATTNRQVEVKGETINITTLLTQQTPKENQ